jgi:hypothetical protein
MDFRETGLGFEVDSGGSCEYGDELSDSGTMELVGWLFS